MSKKSKTLPKQIEEQTHNLQLFLDEPDWLDSLTADEGGGQFKMPYTTRPNIVSPRWRAHSY